MDVLRERMQDTEKRLIKALKENWGTYRIGSNGGISMDLTNKKVLDGIQKQITQFSRIPIEK